MFLIVTITASGLLLTALYSSWSNRVVGKPLNTSEAPTVSLLIPARNETHAITNSLHQALALDYPKLEIIVLDDLSGDATSEKIRAFAQDGVRFMKGLPPPNGWVGKNWACQQLAQTASGEYLVFCDTDVLLKSKGLNRLIRAMVAGKLDGLSTLPQLLLQSRRQILSYPLLNWLILLIPHQSTALAPAYGGLQIFKTTAYRQHGGFARYPEVMLPELMLARHFSRTGRFRFFNNYRLDTVLLKKPSSLIESRIRYLWPLYRDFYSLGLLHFSLTLLPLISLALYPWLYLIVAAAWLVTIRGHVSNSSLGILALPFICLLELGLLMASILRHRRGAVAWKQRDVSQSQLVTHQQA